MDADEHIKLECLVAAILTVGSVSEEVHGIPYMVDRYADILQRLRSVGGPINPVKQSR